MNKLLSRFAVASALLAGVASAHADLTFFTSEDAYLSYLGRPVTDDFSDLAGLVGQDIAPAPQRQLGSFGFGVYSFSLAQSASDTVYVSGTADNPSISTSSNYSILIVDNMTGGANAFGAYIWGINGTNEFRNATISFEVLDAAGVDKVFTFTPTAADQGSFIGVISNTTLRVINAWIDPASLPAGVDSPYVVMDNVTLGVAAAVPEPSSYAMLLGGIAALGAVVRRRKAQAPATC